MTATTAPAPTPAPGLPVTTGTGINWRRATPVLAAVAAFAAIVVVLGDPFPSWWDFRVAPAVDSAKAWIIGNRADHWFFSGVLQPITDLLEALVRWSEDFLELLGWPGIFAATAFIAYRAAGWRIALVSVGCLVAIGVLGVWEEAIQTMALMMVAVAIALLIGVPLGIMAGLHPKVDGALRGFLDAAQTMPAYCYLLFTVLLFDIGAPAAVIATVIFALAPAVRLTAHGIRAVSPGLIEVGAANGATDRQVLGKIQWPLARPAILLGVNQVIMMAFGVVVIAALVGSPGLGQSVLNGLEKIDVGLALDAGLAIVLVAVILDRISSGRSLGRTARPRPAGTGGQARASSSSAWPSSLRPSSSAGWPARTSSRKAGRSRCGNRSTTPSTWLQENVRTGVPVIGGTSAISDFLVVRMLEPLRQLLADTPWWIVTAAIGVLAWCTAGRRVALISVGCLLAIGGLRFWPEAMDTLSQVIVAVALAVLIAVPIGILAGRSDTVDRAAAPLPRRGPGAAGVRLPDPRDRPVQRGPRAGPGGVRDLRRPGRHPPDQPGHPSGAGRDRRGRRRLRRHTPTGTVEGAGATRRTQHHARRQPGDHDEPLDGHRGRSGRLRGLGAGCGEGPHEESVRVGDRPGRRDLHRAVGGRPRPHHPGLGSASPADLDRSLTRGSSEMRRRVRFGLAAALALSMVAAACGSDDDGGGSAGTEGGAEETSSGGSGRARPPAGDGDEVVRLAVNPWTGSAVNAHVAKAVIETAGLGSVELVEIDENAMWPAISKGDTLDGVLEIWPSGHAADYETYITGNQGIIDGGLLGPDAKIGWYVPQFVIDEHPELATWEGFKDAELAGLFKTAESGDQGQFLMGDPSYVSYDEQIIENLELPLKFVTAGSEAALITAIQNSIADQKPLLLQFWQPHWLQSQVELAEVELPEFTDECAASAAANDGKYACDYPVDKLYKAFSDKLEGKAPNSFAVLSNLQLTTEQQNEIAALIDGDEDLEPAAAAQQWVDANEDVWKAWLPA